MMLREEKVSASKSTPEKKAPLSTPKTTELFELQKLTQCNIINAALHHHFRGLTQPVYNPSILYTVTGIGFS